MGSVLSVTSKKRKRNTAYVLITKFKSQIWLILFYNISKTMNDSKITIICRLFKTIIQLIQLICVEIVY